MDDEQSSSAAPVDTGSETSTAPVETSSTETSTEESTDQSSPAESTTAETTTTEQLTDGETQVPDEGDEPDTGNDPDAGDEATEPNSLKGMTREQRAEFFKQQQEQQRKSVEQAINQVYQPQPVDELTEAYMNEGYDQFQATMLARETQREQQAQIAEARAEIAELNSSLITEAMEVVNTIDWLDDSKADKFDQSSADAASQLYEALAIEKDPRTNQIVNAKISPKQFYTLIDQIRQSGAKQAGLSARKAAEQEIASVAPPTSTTNVRDTPFAELSPSEMRAKLEAQGHVF